MAPTIYFQQIDTPISARDAIAQVYHQPQRDSEDILKKINNLSGNEFMYPGEFLCVPSLSGIPEQSIPLLQNVSSELKHSTTHAKKPPAPRQFNEGFSQYLYAQAPDIGIDIMNQFVGGRAKFIESTVSEMKDDLRQLNGLLLKSASRSTAGVPHGAPKFSAFGAEKAVIFQKLQRSLRVLPKGFEVMKANATSAQDALGISNRTVKRAFKANGSAVEIKQIKTAMATADEAARVTSNGAKYLGISLQIAMGAKTIYENVSSTGPVAQRQRANPGSADIIGLHATGKDIGQTAGSYVGGLAGAGLATVLLSNPVGWAGLAVVGIAAVAAGATGGYLGGQWGGAAAAEGMRIIDPSRSDEIDIVVSADE